MIENVGRKVAAVLFVLAAGIAAIVWPLSSGKPVLNLGLDLRGGSRLVYRFDFEEARRQKLLSPNEKNADVLNQTIQIISGRIDSLGLREIPIAKQGTDSIAIELPGLEKETAEGIKGILERLGSLEFRILADPQDGIDLGAEERKLEEWRAKNPEGKLAAYNLLPENAGGPRKGIRWTPLWVDKKDPTRRADPLPGFGDPVPLRDEEALGKPEWVFKGEDLSFVGQTLDEKGAPAVAFELKPEKARDFGEFTERFKLRAMAIVLDGAVRSGPVIQDRLPGRGQINGGIRGFSIEEMNELMTVLRSGSLKLTPILESEFSIGPSLGEDAVRLGSLSALVSGLLVCVFMIGYYRIAGAVAIAGIFLNVGLLLASLAFLHGTLTLPGIGGIALTIGMAVDANILFYERMREEREKGRTLAQSVANGFDRAFSAIIDSNLTTLLAGFILLKVGTGPIKGFAVTLNIGILTTLFVALVVTPVLFHLLHAAGALKELRMMRLLSKPALRYSRYRHACVAASTLLILGGLLVFWNRGERLYGLDFTGGAVVRARMKEAVSIEEVRRRIPEAQVNAVRGEGDDPAALARGVSHEFTIKIKLSAAERAAIEAEEAKAAAAAPESARATAPAPGRQPRRFVEEIRKALEDILLARPLTDLDVAAGGGVSGAPLLTARLHLKAPVEAADLIRGLEQAGLVQPSAEPDPTGAAGRDWRIRGSAPKEATVETIQASLLDAFARAKVPLNDPIAEASVLSPRVVAELRDKAILALVLSWIGIALYLRIRFHEYRYGIAAVVALVHDVLVTLGAVSVANALGLVDVEIDLSMIAAFLTIIGFSVNDTIVIYDRIRENLPKYTDHLGRRKEDLTVIVDEAVNQTLSRTIMTSGTVLLTTLAMFLVNRGAHTVLEGWAFAMSVGVVTGTYSTVYIAAPLLVTFDRFARKAASSQAPPSPAPAAPHASAPAEVEG
ncbi:MAG TPA: protein translocase subunit SecD [Planctomycetota bacterium]|jgi:SecD/SecF fusion protein|nr:protein translocase subunit SecD [Planctomycetota bacterium]